MGKITFYVARHGKTIMNTLDRVQGWCDSPLTEEGSAVAEYLGHGLKDIEFRAGYCSDLRRTRQTIETILGTHGQKDLPITEKFGFREVCFGSSESDFNHVIWGNVAKRLGCDSQEAMMKASEGGNVSYIEMLEIVKANDTLGMAELYADVEKRSQDAIRKIAEEESKKGDANILIVSHAMCIGIMLYSLGEGEYPDNMIDNASVSKVVYEDGKFYVESVGDMSYVKKGKELLSVI